MEFYCIVLRNRAVHSAYRPGRRCLVVTLLSYYLILLCLYSSLCNMLRTLADPYLVVKFQRLCGLRERKPKDSTLLQEKAPWESTRAPHLNGCVEKRNGFRNGYSMNGVKNGFHVYPDEPLKNGFIKNGFVRPEDAEGDTMSMKKDFENLFQNDNYEYNTFMHILFMVGSTLGYEIFYITFFPFVFWNMDEFVARRMVLLWALFMYFGQATKDVIQWPRPPSPPVLSIETRFEFEFGMPSTHAMVGTLVPFCLVYFTYDRYLYPLSYGVVFFLVYCLLVATSRLYMGMHTLQDILAGIAYTSVLLCIIIPLVDINTDKWLFTSPHSPIFMVAIPIAMIVVYPSPPSFTQTRADTATVIGCASGVMLACWFKFSSVGVPDPYLGAPFPLVVPTLSKIIKMAGRFLVGILVVMPTRSFSKALIMDVAPRLLPGDNVKTKRSAMELPHRFLTYAVVSFSAVYVAPLCFPLFGL